MQGEVNALELSCAEVQAANRAVEMQTCIQHQ